MNYKIRLLLLLQCFATVFAQRVAPGVPPQHYQQPQYQQQQVPVQQHQVPVQQQYQQPQQIPQQQHMPQQQHIPQQQQMPQYQQHVPQQQNVPQQHQQNVPQQHQPSHGHQGGHNPQLLNPGNMEHEKEHIAEHLEVPIDTSKMSEQELQFHYFKMHDADNNNKLDGCELIKSLIHWHEEGSKHKHEGGGQDNQVAEKIFADDELIGLIDPILNMDDGNKDGYIDYPEFVRAQQKAQAAHAQPNQNQ